MKQAQGNGAPKGRKHLRMDRTAQQYKGLCEGDCERGNYLCIVNQKRRGGIFAAFNMHEVKIFGIIKNDFCFNKIKFVY